MAHVFDLGFSEMREFVLILVRAEGQIVGVFEDLAKVVAARRCAWTQPDRERVLDRRI